MFWGRGKRKEKKLCFDSTESYLKKENLCQTNILNFPVNKMHQNLFFWIITIFLYFNALLIYLECYGSSLPFYHKNIVLIFVDFTIARFFWNVTIGNVKALLYLYLFLFVSFYVHFYFLHSFLGYWWIISEWNE